MELQSLRDHLDSRLDKIEDKLDNHLERIATAETSIEWIRGHIKFMVSLSVALAGSIGTAIYRYFTLK